MCHALHWPMACEDARRYHCRGWRWESSVEDGAWGCFVTAGFFVIAGLVLMLLAGCAVSVGVSGVQAGITVDPGKLAPLMKEGK